jgi:hypothetical protein
VSRDEQRLVSPRPSDDELGRQVRDEWVAWAREQPDPKPSWLVPWDDLAERDKDADRRIGRALFNTGVVTAMRTLREVNEGMP